MSDTTTGSCLCGNVVYQVNGPLRPVVGCHCVQCRKTTGHFMAATGANLANFTITSSADLKWYRSSDSAQRGFCGTCGSTLFWQADGKDYIAIAAGTIDGNTGLHTEGHIFCESAGDYYEISDGSFQQEGGGHTVPTPN